MLSVAFFGMEYHNVEDFLKSLSLDLCQYSDPLWKKGFTSLDRLQYVHETDLDMIEDSTHKTILLDGIKALSNATKLGEKEKSTDTQQQQSLTSIQHYTPYYNPYFNGSSGMVQHPYDLRRTSTEYRIFELKQYLSVKKAYIKVLTTKLTNMLAEYPVNNEDKMGKYLCSNCHVKGKEYRKYTFCLNLYCFIVNMV
jgi:hypothetical protein